jgi:hypothetical protein
MYMHQLGDLFTWVAMLHILFNLIMKPKKIFFFLYIFSHEKNQIFIICNGFVGAKLDLHHLKCNLLLKCLLMCFFK